MSVCPAIVLVTCSEVTFLNSAYPFASLSHSKCEISNAFILIPKSASKRGPKYLETKSLTSSIFLSICKTGIPLSEGIFVTTPLIYFVKASLICFLKLSNSKFIKRFNLIKPL